MQLTNLELKADAAECIKFLVHSPNFEHLTVECEDGDLPDLMHGQLTNPELLGYLTLPALEELSIWLHPGWTEVVQDPFARSRCSIRKLDIRAYYFAGHERLRGFLRLSGLRSIQDLTLRGPEGTDGALEVLLLKIEQDPSFLPLLESLAIRGCEFIISLPILVHMLCARMEREEGEAKLKSFQLPRDDAEIYKCDESVEVELDKLRGLRSQGLNVDIQSNFKFWNSYIDPSVLQRATHYSTQTFTAKAVD
ncbi:hypothetical protein FB45DRAFT_1115994 [Roridomyces roridus]|uniref:Uncharacterized protein n=1 Tax=Roridomyces roridus TaxID=1738132 RepID=A0AAD7CBY1_9AGAR|nr:hypothetical protein FB45DRAFT_1115994 [Roridomyces roridus]